MGIEELEAARRGGAFSRFFVPTRFAQRRCRRGHRRGGKGGRSGVKMAQILVKYIPYSSVSFSSPFPSPFPLVRRVHVCSSARRVGGLIARGRPEAKRRGDETRRDERLTRRPQEGHEERTHTRDDDRSTHGEIERATASFPPTRAAAFPSRVAAIMLSMLKNVADFVTPVLTESHFADVRHNDTTHTRPSPLHRLLLSLMSCR